MDDTNLGASGARVSRLALGTMNFGPIVDPTASFAMMDRAVGGGITFFDNADVYGGPPLGSEVGHSERLQGEWMSSRRNRDQLVIATKVQGRTGDGPNDRGLSAVHIRAAVDASLRRLQTDRIDLYQMHHIERDQPVDEVLEALSILRQQGKILYVGSSNFPAWWIAVFREAASRSGFPPLVTEQSVYNLANRALESEVVPAMRHYGMGLLAYSPLAGGLLSGILSRTDAHRSAGLRDRLGARRESVERFEALASRIEVPPAQLALAWLLSRPVVTAPVVGPRTIGQLDDALAAERIHLDSATLDALDGIWSGAGEAPESYAW